MELSLHPVLHLHIGEVDECVGFVHKGGLIRRGRERERMDCGLPLLFVTPSHPPMFAAANPAEEGERVTARVRSWRSVVVLSQTDQLVQDPPPSSSMHLLLLHRRLKELLQQRATKNDSTRASSLPIPKDEDEKEQGPPHTFSIT
jgi:hypothetical protein